MATDPTSSTGPSLTLDTLRKLMADLGPMPPDVSRHELRANLWVPDDGKVYRVDMAASRLAMRLDQGAMGALAREAFDVSSSELAAAPDVVIMAHPDFLARLRADGMTDQDILATVEALRLQEERDRNGQKVGGPNYRGFLSDPSTWS